MLFFEASAGGGQIGGVNQSHRTLPPSIVLNEGLEELLIDLPESGDAQPRPKLMQHAHVGHAVLPPQPGELSPGGLLRQHLHQQVQGMDWREQAQEMDAKELRGGVLAVPATGRAVWPALIDEIVGDERGE